LGVAIVTRKRMERNDMQSHRFMVLSIAFSAMAVRSAQAAPPAGDFDNDGFNDLVIGVPYETLGEKPRTGGVHILAGSAAQLSDTGDQYLHQATTAIVESHGNDDQFSSALAWGDFDNDGFDDLAIGVHGEDFNGIARTGVVIVLYGSPSKLSADGDQLWHQNVGGITSTSQADEHFGYALAAGDFDGDGFDDLAIGVPGERVNGAASAGAVNVIYGSAGGLSAAGDQFFTQDSASIADSPQNGDQFGYVLTVGNFNGDGFADLAISAPFEDHEGQSNAGVVHFLYGTAGGLTGVDSDELTQDDSSPVEVPEVNDLFGAALVAGDFNDDGFDDIAIGVPLENVGAVGNAGAVIVFYGHDGGIEDDPEELWTQNTLGITDSSEIDDRFGAALACGDFDGDGIDDLAIGVPHEDVSGWANAGAVHLLYGTGGGLSATGDEFLTQNSPGVPSDARTSDRFGFALAAGDFDDDGFADLAIGVPGERVSGINAAGSVNVAYGAAGGLDSATYQLWHQNGDSMPDSCESNDQFGNALGAPPLDTTGLP
jgi:hypothetical protein